MPFRPNTLRTTGPFVLGWTALGVGFVLALGYEEPRPAGIAFGAAVGAGLGLVSAWFEFVALPRFGRRLSPWAAVLVRTAFYVSATGAVAVGLAAVGWAARGVFGTGRLEVYGVRETWVYVQSPHFATTLGLAAATSFVVNAGRQVRLVLGPGTLWALFAGRYRLPVAEDRAFLFLDLTGSTAIAQRLGPALFNEFKNDFFRDVAGPILATGGRIYQYVGDEVVVTWRVRGGRLPRSPVETFVPRRSGRAERRPVPRPLRGCPDVQGGAPRRAGRDG